MVLHRLGCTASHQSTSWPCSRHSIPRCTYLGASHLTGVRALAARSFNKRWSLRCRERRNHLPARFACRVHTLALSASVCLACLLDSVGFAVLGRQEWTAFMPPAIAIAMPSFRDGLMQETNDGHLTWATASNFSTEQGADNVEAKNWQWDADRAGKSGAAASRYPTSYFSLVPDHRSRRSKPPKASYSFETCIWKQRASFVKLNAGFVIDRKSAALPAPSDDVPPPRKWNVEMDEWVPRDSEDPPPGRVRRKYRKLAWAYWG